ncbi:dienelactone hydrolase family protein [Microbacteriaceae bacterium VKM Ac-2855]|nr:dienelactone hydrolase family protein [Microbacteriaceae bacterium VKM Ac-2855]
MTDETWTLAGFEVPMHVALPETESGESEPGPAIIVIHEVWGLDGHIRSVVDRYAAEGYRAFGPELLLGSGILEELTEQQRDAYDHPIRRLTKQVEFRTFFAPVFAPEFTERTIAELRALVDRVLERDDVTSVSVTGFCYGGSMTWALAVADPRLAAAVPFYGHNTFSAEELAGVKTPVLAFYGAEDAPLVAQLPGIREALPDADTVVYPDAGHAFFNESNEQSYRPGAAQDSWARTLAFLAQHA